MSINGGYSDFEAIARVEVGLQTLQAQVHQLEVATSSEAKSRSTIRWFVTAMAAMGLAWIGWVSTQAIEARAAADVLQAEHSATNQAILQRLDRMDRHLDALQDHLLKE